MNQFIDIRHYHKLNGIITAIEINVLRYFLMRQEYGLVRYNVAWGHNTTTYISRYRPKNVNI